MPLPPIPICPQEPWEAQEYMYAHRDRSRVKFSFCVRPGVVTRPLGRKVTTAEADHCRTLKAIGSAEDSCCALDRLQWVRNGLTLFTADDYNSKVLSERGGAGQRVGYTKTGPRASLRGDWVRSLFTPFDARADFILGTDCGRHGGRLQNPRT